MQFLAECCSILLRSKQNTKFVKFPLQNFSLPRNFLAPKGSFWLCGPLKKSPHSQKGSYGELKISVKRDNLSGENHGFAVLFYLNNMHHFFEDFILYNSRPEVKSYSFYICYHQNIAFSITHDIKCEV